MDFVRKLVRGSSVVHAPTKEDHTFSLLTLRRLFLDFCSNSQSIGQSEQEEKLYAMLPLFYEVFCENPQSMGEKFVDVLQFSTQIARLMVTEIRRRASNKSTEEASLDISKYLIVHSGIEDSRGWLLLNVINLLAVGGQQVVDCMTTMHLPSTLVKCLYLFFDLPPITMTTNSTNLSSSTDNISSPKYKVYHHGTRKPPVAESPMKRGPHLPSSILALSKASMMEKREGFHKVFVQVVMRLCLHISPAEELSHRDDLSLLFSAVTSWCPPHNVSWRKASAEILSAISRHGLSHNVVQYIRSKKCVATCVENMQRSLMTRNKNAPTDGEISVLDLAFALESVLKFIYDTSEVTQLLLDDFKQCNGYQFILEYLFCLEQLCNESQQHRECLQMVVNAVETLTACGFKEITPSPSVQSPFQSNYVIPIPIGKGLSVRNIEAFEVLEKLFIRGTSSLLSCAVLDAILNIYQRDPANYFILSVQHTVSIFSERLHFKDDKVITKYFLLLEYIIVNLGYVPVKELVSLTLLLKDENMLKCNIATVKCLQKVFHHERGLYGEVFRDVGVFEVLVNCLVRYANYLKDNTGSLDEEYEYFGDCTMDLLADLIYNSPTNAAVFREIEGAQCAHSLIPFIQCRQKALVLVERLILQPSSAGGGDDDMGILLGLLSTVAAGDLTLKIDILRSLLKVVTESRDARIVFRKVGGFINVISVLVSIEGCLENPRVGLWESKELQEILKLLQITFQTLSAALRLPSNRRFFQTEIRFDSLRSALQYLGCFDDEYHLYSCDKYLQPTDPPMITISLRDIDINGLVRSNDSESLPVNCISILAVFKLLYLLATDSFQDELQMTLQESLSASASIQEILSTASTTQPSQFVLHPNACSVMLSLIPFIPADPQVQMQIDLQHYMLNEVITLLNLERNEQILCRSDLVSTLLSCYGSILAQDDHPLNSSVQRIIERLVTQASTPRELREFLRIGKPLHCSDALVRAKPVSLSRVKNLVSMATPRNISFQEDFDIKTSLPPAFIEFDMSLQGCGYLFIPSMFPQTAPEMMASTDSILLSGIGSGERTFPPAGGISIFAWVYIEKFCQNNLHPLRILTITREILSTKVKYTCLSVHITAKDKKLLISTQEEDFNSMGPGDIEEVTQLISTTISFDTQHLLSECQWHHIVVTINKATVLKHSTATAYIDGNVIGSAKVRYIHSYPNGSSAPNSPVMVQAYIGTPPKLLVRSSLLWRIASLHVIDESITSTNLLSSITSLGPSYTGNFQSIQLQDKTIGSVVAEERVCLSILPCSYETLSMSRLKKRSHKLDGRAVSQQLNVSLQDGLSPVLLFRNCCMHCTGQARSFGAVTLQDLATSGIRHFCPAPVAKVLQSIGGVTIILSLVSMASDIESLYAAVKSLACVIESNPVAAKEMDRIRGYQALAMHLKQKKELLNSHVLHLAYSLTGTVHAGRGSSFIPNVPAFEDLLCDLEVWHNAPNELHKSLFEHLLRLMTESMDTNDNIGIMQDLGMTRRCLHFIVSDNTLSMETTKLILRIINILINNSSEDKSDLLRFGQFLASTIPEHSEKNIKVTNSEIDFVNVKSDQVTPEGTPRKLMHNKRTTARDVCLRNLGIRMLRDCLQASVDQSSTTFCESIQRTLGWDWVLLFQLEHLHMTTVVESLLLLLEMLWCGRFKSSPPQSISSSSLASTGGPGGTVTPASPAERFRSGELCGGWLLGSNVFIEESKADSLLGFNVSGGEDKVYEHQVCLAACSTEGFVTMASLLSHHADIPQIYLLLLRFIVGDKPIDPLEIHKLDLDVMYHHILGVQNSDSGPSPNKIGSPTHSGMSAVTLDLLQVVLEIVRSMLSQKSSHELPSSFIMEFPTVILRTLIYIYQFNHANLASMFTTQQFLLALISTIFPKTNSYQAEEANAEEVIQNITLSQHPAKKFVFDLLQLILFDTLSASFSDTHYQVINVILESIPDQCTMVELQEFQTNIISYFMSKLLAADPLSGENGALLHGGGGMQVFKDGKSTAYSNIQSSIVFLTSRIVDRVWLNMYQKETNDVFDFISKLIHQAQQKSSNCGSNITESLYRSLYRIVFYQLSRRHHTVTEQMVVLDAVHCAITNKNLIFNSNVHDPLLMPCLCHCLFMLSSDSYGHGFGVEEENRQTVWHVTSPDFEKDITIPSLENHNVSEDKPKGNSEEPSITDPKSPKEKGKLLLSKAVARLWQEIPQSAKQYLEETSKVQLVDLGGSQANLDAARIRLQEFASKSWSNYLSLEKKGLAAVKGTQKFTKKISSSMLGGNKNKNKREKNPRMFNQNGDSYQTSEEAD